MSRRPGVSHNPPVGNEGWLIPMGGRGDRFVFQGGESEQRRPRDLEPGGTKIYDHNGNVVSLVMADMRFVHATKIVFVAPVIVLGIGTDRRSKRSAYMSMTRASMLDRINECFVSVVNSDRDLSDFGASFAGSPAESVTPIGG